MQKFHNIYLIGSNDGDVLSCSPAQLLTSLGVAFSRIDAGVAGIDGLRERAPGCVLLDIDVAGIDAGAVFDSLRSRRASLPVVILSSCVDTAVILDFMRLGASDYLVRPTGAAALAECLGRVFDRIDSEVVTYHRQLPARRKVEALTDRERDILHGLLAGGANKTLAWQLGISVRTIEMHRAHLMAKLEVQNLAQAIRLAFDAGLELDRPAGQTSGPGAVENAFPAIT